MSKLFEITTGLNLRVNSPAFPPPTSYPPNTVIGMLPDVGAAHVLSRLPGGLGQYLGLTGARLRANDLLYCGLATHLVPRDRYRPLRNLCPQVKNCRK